MNRNDRFLIWYSKQNNTLECNKNFQECGDSFPLTLEDLCEHLALIIIPRQIAFCAFILQSTTLVF